MASLDKAVITRIGAPPADIKEFYYKILMRDGYLSALKIHKPAHAHASPGALVVLCFGGAFVGGTNDQLTDIARALVRFAGATVVNISYRLAPEHPFPASQLDAIDSVRWIAENATSSTLAADPSKGFVLGGVSAGASLTACLSRLFQAEKLACPLTGQWLCVPPIMDRATCPEKYQHLWISREQDSLAPFLGAKELAATALLVRPDWTSELRIALRSNSPLPGQPKTYFQVDGMDPLRDDGLIYDEMLKEAGVPTRIDFYPGCPHGHWAVTTDYAVGAKALIDSVVGIAWLLDEAFSREDVAKMLVVPLH